MRLPATISSICCGSLGLRRSSDLLTASGVIIVQLAFMLLLSVLLLIFKSTGYVIDRREGVALRGMDFFFVLISVISENSSIGL